MFPNIPPATTSRSLPALNVFALNPVAISASPPPTLVPSDKTLLVNCVPLFIVTEPVKSPAGNYSPPEVPPPYPEPLTEAVTVPDEPNPCEP